MAKIQLVSHSQVVRLLGCFWQYQSILTPCKATCQQTFDERKRVPSYQISTYALESGNNVYDYHKVGKETHLCISLGKRIVLVNLANVFDLLDVVL